MKRVILMVIWTHFWVPMTEREYNEHPVIVVVGGCGGGWVVKEHTYWPLGNKTSNANSLKQQSEVSASPKTKKKKRPTNV